MIIPKVRDAIVRKNKLFEKAIQDQGASVLASLYTVDGEVLASTVPPIRGRRQIKAFWQNAFNKGVRKVELQTMHLAGDADFLYEKGKYMLKGENNQMLDLGKYLNIWVKNNGEWEIKVDIFNSSLKTLSDIYEKE